MKILDKKDLVKIAEWILKIIIKRFNLSHNTRGILTMFHHIIVKKYPYVITAVNESESSSSIIFNYHMDSKYAMNTVFPIIINAMRDRESDLFLTGIMPDGTELTKDE